jgi:hypothetical protein
MFLYFRCALAPASCMLTQLCTVVGGNGQMAAGPNGEVHPTPSPSAPGSNSDQQGRGTVRQNTCRSSHYRTTSRAAAETKLLAMVALASQRSLAKPCLQVVCFCRRRRPRTRRLGRRRWQWPLPTRHNSSSCSSRRQQLQVHSCRHRPCRQGSWLACHSRACCRCRRCCRRGCRQPPAFLVSCRRHSHRP